MYIPPPFKVHPALALAFAGARGFGLVTACDGGRPVASPLPFLLTEAPGKPPHATFHVARGNPLAVLAEKGGEWLITTLGADAYVSPLWYASAEQVPTWLYESVQLSGPVGIVPAAHTQAHVDALSARFESGASADASWSSERLSAERKEMLLKAIVVIDMIVEKVEGSFKLNQHKPDADHVAIAAALAAQADPGAKAIAERMIALRPHLLYEGLQAADTGERAPTGERV